MSTASYELGRIPRSDLGKSLNRVEHPIFPCPSCSLTSPMSVYVAAVRWACGHTRTLPAFRPNWPLIKMLRRVS